MLREGWIDAEPRPSFPLDLAYEEGHYLSLLYYMGLLTLQKEGDWPRLGIPNYAIRTLYWDRERGVRGDGGVLDEASRRGPFRARRIGERSCCLREASVLSAPPR